MPLAVFLDLIAPVFAWVGLVHLALGVRADELPGAQWPEQTLRAAAFDGQHRFQGIACSLYGVLLTFVPPNFGGTLSFFGACRGHSLLQVWRCLCP